MKEFTEISVKTMPNGYSLKVGKNDFFYFSEVELLAGFMSHVGLRETKEIERGSLMSGLLAAMLGESYSNSVEVLKQRVQQLATEYLTTTERMDKAVKFVNASEQMINGMNRRIESADIALKNAEKELIKHQKKYDELVKKMKEMEKRAAKCGILTEETELDDAIVKKVEPKKTSRKKNDVAVLREIEKQAADNPNIK
jgi:chromosome segregation ATPase